MKHPATPSARLSLEIFENWQCTDVQDKAFRATRDVAKRGGNRSTDNEVQFWLMTSRLCLRRDDLKYSGFYRRTLRLSQAKDHYAI